MFSMPPATATRMLPSAIDRERGGRDRQAGTDSRLPGRIHLVAGLHDIPHDDGLYLLGAKLCASDRGRDCGGTEGGSRDVFERTRKGADRRANRLRKNNLRCHGNLLRATARIGACLTN
jgi:hypothetical protein